MTEPSSATSPSLVPGNGAGAITLGVIPDSQALVRYTPAAYLRLVGWLAEHADEVDAVVHVGDVVDCGAEDEAQFELAARAHDLLVEAGIPYVLAAGNHDYDDRLTHSRALTCFNRHLGEAVMAQPSFHSSFEPGAVENSALLIDTPVRQLLVLALEFGPRPDVVAWADDVVRSSGECAVFLTTHAYLDPDGERTGARSRFHPRSFPAAADGLDGAELWRDLVRRHDNLVAVFSGHQIPGVVSHRVDPGSGGAGVLQAYQNWQCAPPAAAGRLRMVRWWPRTDRLDLWVVDTATGDQVDRPGYRAQVRVGPGAEPTRYPATRDSLTAWPE